MVDGEPPATEGTWHGISFPAQGQLRLTRMNMSVDEHGQPHFDVGPIEVRSDVWPSWFAIAQQQRDLARAARDSNPGREASDEDAFGTAINLEYQAAMLSVCASAFALEAFANSVHHHVPASKVSGRSADARIHQTLTRAFRLTNEQSGQLRSTLQQIFRFRDRAVHAPAAFVAPAGHPVFSVGMDPRFVIFRVENAETCCKFIHEALWSCLNQPRGSGEFQQWCEAMAQIVGRPT